jgi:hypothetical protein
MGSRLNIFAIDVFALAASTRHHQLDSATRQGRSCNPSIRRGRDPWIVPSSPTSLRLKLRVSRGYGCDK